MNDIYNAALMAEQQLWIKDYLRNNLKIESSYRYKTWKDSPGIKIELLLGEEVISECVTDLPAR